MIIYENNIEFSLLDKITGGFILSLMIHAEDNFVDDDEKKKEFSEDDYNELCNYDFKANNLSPEVIDRSSAIVEEFLSKFDREQQAVIKGMEAGEKIGLGNNLYNTLVRGIYCMDEEYEQAVKGLTPVTFEPGIEKDDNGAVRIIFK